MPVVSSMKLATICFYYLSIRDEPQNGAKEGGSFIGGFVLWNFRPIIDKWSD